MENQIPRLDSVHVVEATEQTSADKKRFRLRFSISPRLRKLIAIILGFLLFLLLLSTTLPLAQKYMQGEKKEQAPQVSPTPASQETSFVPSPYANDEKVLELEEKVLQLEAELELIDFREETLQPPNLDWNVEFD